MPPEALLAIRSDIAAAVEQEYLEWLTKEHTLERLAIDGFVSARIFRSKHQGFGRYLILYELDDASVVDSPAYLERLNNPTHWTTRMMPHLGNFVRGGGRLTINLGAGYGAALIPIMTTAEICTEKNLALNTVLKSAGVVAIRVLHTDSGRTTAASNERKLRSGDQSFDALLMIETLDKEVAERAVGKLPPNLFHLRRQQSETLENLAYAQIFSLNG